MKNNMGKNKMEKKKKKKILEGKKEKK